MAESPHAAPPSVRSPDDRPNSDRLDSWKEIASYLHRDVTTVQRWEKREGMPVHRHLHDSKGSVYASRVELDAWVRSRKLPTSEEIEFGASSPIPINRYATATDEHREIRTPQPPMVRSRLVITAVFACLLLAAAGWLAYKSWPGNSAPPHIQRSLTPTLANHLTEQRVTSNSPEAPVEHAVVSPDGKYLAYSDPTGLYLRVIASGETRRWEVPKDFNAVPASWFPDGTHLLVARFDGPTPSIWKLSLFGAAPRKLIDKAGPASVSPDGTRIAFVTSPPDSGNQLWVMEAD